MFAEAIRRSTQTEKEGAADDRRYTPSSAANLFGDVDIDDQPTPEETNIEEAETQGTDYNTYLTAINVRVFITF